MAAAPAIGEINLVAITGANPFEKEGLSEEVRALLAYLVAAKAATGVDVVVTSTTDHAELTTSNNPSRHRAAGTDGRGLAVDCALRKGGNDVHQSVFDLFKIVEGSLHELIYAKAEHNIKRGKRVAPFAEKDHHNHVHVSVDKGTFLQFPSAAQGRQTLTREEEDMTPAQANQLAAVAEAVGRIEIDVRDPNNGISKRLADLSAKVDQLASR